MKQVLPIWKDSLAASISRPEKKAIFVLGPTASGKSGWALEMAAKYNGSIINIDSVQFYSGLIVGAAAPTEQDKARVPHHLYSYVNPPEEMTAGNYLRDFYKLLENPDLKFPLFIVGGTGFYIQALEKGMFDVEPVPPEIRAVLEDEIAKGNAQALHQELLAKDPHSKIHVNDHYRLVRALEIIRYNGVTPTELQASSRAKKYEFPFPFIKLGFDFEKSEYLARVAKRTKQMIDNGIIDEAKTAFDKGFSDWAPMHSVGYREALQFLSEKQSIEWLEKSINQSTMQLIKKQKTWFKRDASVLWSNQAEQLDQFLT